MLWWTDYAWNTVTGIVPTTLLPLAYFCQMTCGNHDGQVQFTAAKRLLKIALAKLSKDSATTKRTKAHLYFRSCPKHALTTSFSLFSTSLPFCEYSSRTFSMCSLPASLMFFFLRISMYSLFGTEDTIG